MDDFLVPQLFWFPLMRPENLSDYMRPATLNLGLGACFTYENIEPKEFSAVTIAMFGLKMHEAIWSYVISIHDHGKFLPLFGLGSEYTGQFYISAE